MRSKSAGWRVLLAGVLLLSGGMLAASGQDLTDVPLSDIDDLMDEETDLLTQQMEDLEEGDQKPFKIVTDDDISKVARGDIYKSNQSFFKVMELKAKGTDGGVLVVARIRGRMDPSMKWTRVSGEGPLVVGSRQTLMQRFLSGGAVMYPIAFLLLLMLIVTIRCTFYFRESLHCPRQFAEECGKAILSGDLEKFEELSLKQKGLLAHTCRVMVSNYRRLTVEEVKSRCEAEAVHEVGRLSFPLRVLNFVAVAAPLLGLLGTVLGMILCFESLAGETATQSKAMAMAAGIKQALLTTAFGLIVALPSLMSFFIFTYRVNQIANLCAVSAEELLHELAVLRRQAGGAPQGTGRAEPDPKS